MRRFLLYCVLFGAIIVSTLLLGECIIASSDNCYKYKHEWMLDNAEKVETLILGSSHAYYGISPLDFCEKSFNLANISQNFEYDYLLLKNYEKRLTELKTVILPMSYCSLFDARFEDGDEWWYAINYKKYMDVDVHSDFSKYNFEISKLSVYSGRLLKILSGNGLPPCDSLGFGMGYTLSARSQTWQEDACVTVKRHTARDWSAFDWNLACLRSILALCRERSWRPVLVTLPSSHHYYNSLDSAQIGKMYEVVELMKSEYADVEYFDFLRDGNFVDEDFFDCDHLSDIGARKFSKMFKDSISY